MSTPQQPIALPLSAEDVEGARKEFPWRNIISLLLYRIAHAASWIVIFPFITDMVTSFNVAQQRIGLYAGLGEGVLMLTEAAAAPLWAMISDRYGRRPTMVWSFGLCVIPMCLLGFSTKPWHIVVSRGACGALSSQGIITTILTESSNPHNRVKLYALAAPTWHIGAVIGTVIGGQLARPSGRLPVWLGGRAAFFAQWPYALPCLTIGGIGLLATLVGAIMLQETRRSADLLCDDDHDGHAVAVDTTRNVYLKTLRVPNFLLIIVLMCCIQSMCMAYEGIYAVYTYTSIGQGGLGLSVHTIGLAMGIGSLTFVVATPTILPALIDRFGTIKTQQNLMLLWPLVGLSLPLCCWVAGNLSIFLCPMIGLVQVVRVIGCFVWMLNDVMSMSAFDDAPHLLATGSAISLMSGAFGKAVGPTFAGWIFSLSTQFGSGTLGRQAYWLTFIGMTIPPIILLRYLPRKPSLENQAFEQISQNEDA